MGSGKHLGVVVQVQGPHQANVHKIVESMLSAIVLTDGWTYVYTATTKMCREERAAHQKLLDFIFNGYWKDFQSDL